VGEEELRTRAVERPREGVAGNEVEEPNEREAQEAEDSGCFEREEESCSREGVREAEEANGQDRAEERRSEAFG
jgi:hypothetical protein